MGQRRKMATLVTGQACGRKVTQGQLWHWGWKHSSSCQAKGQRQWKRNRVFAFSYQCISFNTFLDDSHCLYDWCHVSFDKQATNQSLKIQQLLDCYRERHEQLQGRNIWLSVEVSRRWLTSFSPVCLKKTGRSLHLVFPPLLLSIQLRTSTLLFTKWSFQNISSRNMSRKFFFLLKWSLCNLT